MSHRERRSDHAPSFALLLVLFALAVRVALPQGYMLSVEAGLPRITVCTGQGAVEMTIDADGQLVDLPAGTDHDPDDGDGSCPYALAQAPGLSVHGSSLLVAPRYLANPIHGRALHQRPGLGLAAPPPPSHAPPALFDVI